MTQMAGDWQLFQYYPLQAIFQCYLLLQQLRRNTSIIKHNRSIIKITALLVTNICGGGGLSEKAFLRFLQPDGLNDHQTMSILSCHHYYGRLQDKTLPKRTINIAKCTALKSPPRKVTKCLLASYVLLSLDRNRYE